MQICFLYGLKYGDKKDLTDWLDDNPTIKNNIAEYNKSQGSKLTTDTFIELLNNT